MKKTGMEKVAAWMTRNGYNFDASNKYGLSYGDLGVHVQCYKVSFENDDYVKLYELDDTNGFAKENKLLEYLKRQKDIVIRDNSSLYYHTYIIVDAGDFVALETFKEWRNEKMEMFTMWRHVFIERYGKENVAA